MGHILGFLVETISSSKICRSAYGIIENGRSWLFSRKMGCVAIDHRPDARTPHPTYISLPYVTFLDFWWRPFLGQKSIGVRLQYY
jgi:hypothetical protein